MKRILAFFVLAVVSLASWDAAPAPGNATGSVAPDPAARGLDLFVHCPSEVAAGSVLPIQVQAIGFPTVTAPRPLAGATVEASWDPQAWPQGVRPVPGAVSTAADGDGRAHLDMGAPSRSGSFKLLLRVRHGQHERVRSVTIGVGTSLTLSLYVSDRKVVPGSTILAWAFARKSDTGLPVAGTAIEFDLKEGTYVRHRLRVNTDDEGLGAARIPIPQVNGIGMGWVLQVRTTSPQTDEVHAATSLAASDETPGAPVLDVVWDEGEAEPGRPAPFTVTVRDGSREPVADLPVRTRVTTHAASRATDDDDWDSTSIQGVTDAAGMLHGSAPTPTTVPAGGLPMRIEARAVLNGHELENAASFELVSTRAPSGRVASNPFDASVRAEAGDLVAGLEQRVILEVTQGGKPVVGAFSLEGDGLSARVRTNALGYAQATWAVPSAVGAFREQGDCADMVAAEIRVLPLDPPGAVEHQCLRVDRDGYVLLQVARTVVRSGDPVAVHIVGTHQGLSLFARSHEAERSVSRWVDAGVRDVDVSLPPDARGVWTISATGPGQKEASQSAVPEAVLVVPRRIPKLVAVQAGGRIAPGGNVIVDALLTDGQKGAMPGTVAALVMDAAGGRDPFDLAQLDTRVTLGKQIGVEDDRRDGFLESEDPDFEPARRWSLAYRGDKPVEPLIDPAARILEDLHSAFETVVQSFEGAVRDAASSHERAIDVRRRGPRGWELNPEIEVVIRDTLGDNGTTPGGEPMSLSDLRAVDSQVDFAHAARRVTREKLLHVLTQVRDYVHAHKLSSDEPILRDPNAIVRRLVRENGLEETDLIDPWGGTMRFVPDGGPRIPFLSLVPGFALHAPGPDRIVGTPDDVRDPFERVLRSGSPYAEAVHEDEIVNAKWDMEVGDNTVAEWTELFAKHTGQSSGFGSGGLGLGGVGEGGGRLSGSHATRAPRLREGSTSEFPSYSQWLPPARTDPSGRVRLSIPLGPIETTWEVWLVGIPDAGPPATTSLSVPVSLPISARVDTGGAWTEGDRGDVVVTLRNRTQMPANVVVTAEARANAVLERPTRDVQNVTVPLGAAQAVHFRVRATRPGEAAIAVTVRAAGTDGDALVHHWPIRAAGERLDISNTAWIDSKSTLAAPVGQGMTPVGPPRLVLERGFAGVLGSVLDSLDLDSLGGPRSIADVAEIADRIGRYALLRGGDKDPLALVADDVVRRASSRLLNLEESFHTDPDVVRAMASASRWIHERGADGPGGKRSDEHQAQPVRNEERCPKDESGSLRERALLLDTAPASVEGSTLACWDAFLATTIERLRTESDPVSVGLAALALAERPERRLELGALVARLRQLSAVRPSGELSLARAYQGDRASRSVVLAALLRTAALVPGLSAPPVRVASWLVQQRDAGGGFGSTQATLYAVRALLPMAEPEVRSATVRVLAEGKDLPKVGVSAPVDKQGRTIDLDPRIASVVLQTDVPGVVARIERPVLRSWANPPDPSGSPLRVDAVWPEAPRTGRNGLLRVRVQHDLGYKVRVRVWIPLPPGIVMSEVVSGVRQVHGTIAITALVDASSAPTLLSVPIRYGISGTFTAPEIVAYVEDDESIRAYAPARPIVVE